MFKKIVLCGVIISGLTFSSAEASSIKNTYVVDDIHGKYVTLVKDSNSKVYVYKKDKFYKGVKVSDVFKKDKKSKFKFMKKETRDRKQEIKKMMKELFK